MNRCNLVATVAPLSPLINPFELTAMSFDTWQTRIALDISYSKTNLQGVTGIPLELKRNDVNYVVAYLNKVNVQRNNI